MVFDMPNSRRLSSNVCSFDRGFRGDSINAVMPFLYSSKRSPGLLTAVLKTNNLATLANQGIALLLGSWKRIIAKIVVSTTEFITFSKISLLFWL